MLRKLFPKASYFLLEDPDVVSRLRADPQGFLDEVKTPAILDEIQRLVPGYNLRRLQLLSGNDQHLQPAAPAPLVQIGRRRDLVLPANDSLFTSGTLGRYSAMLSDLQHNESLRPPTGLTQIETAAD